MSDPITGAPTEDDEIDPFQRFRRPGLQSAADQPLETPRIAGIGPAPGPGVNLPGLPGPDVQKAHERLSGLEGSSSGVDDPGFAQNHPIIHGIAKAGDVLGSIIAPGVTAHIPGTTLYHHAQIAQAQNALNEHEAAAQKEAQTGLEQEQAQEAGARTEQIQNPQEEWAPLQGVTGQNGEPLEYEKHSGQTRAAQLPEGAKPVQKPITNAFELWQRDHPQGTYEEFQKTEQAVKPGNDFEQYYHDYLTENHFPDTAHNRLLARERFAAAGQAPQRPQQQLGAIDGKVVELKPGMSVPQGTESLSGELKGAKPTADEQRRADLANNLNENLNQLEDILNRRPDLFGPAAGRLTTAREFVGTGDPDVAALKTIKEQMGMAMVGAHAMRNAQHVETAANSILNSFNNKPEAIKAAIAASRQSLGTFKQDVENAKHPQAQGGTQQHVPGGAAQGLTEGQTGTGSDGKKYVVKGGVWAPQ